MLSVFLPVLTAPYTSPAMSIQRALDLAATLGAQVFASISEVEIPPLVTPALPLGFDFAALSADAEAQSRARADELTAHIQRDATRMNVTLRLERIRSRQEWIGDVMAAAARTHDLTLFCPGEGVDDRSVEESLLFGAGRPVILIPEGDVPVHMTTVAIAWDGSRSAARALFDAMPVLEMAGQVVVVTAESDKSIDHRSVEGVLAALDRHGIRHRRVEVTLSPEQSIGDGLQDAAVQADAGLLVMGGYGHNRITEFVLGGATRSVLKRQRLAVLLSH